jgi:hypothetical protein
MNRQYIRDLVAHITEAPCPPDAEPIVMRSLQQLEFVFAIEDELNFRHEIPEDVGWTCVNDVVKWLESKGEYKEQEQPSGVHTEPQLP